MEGVLAEASVLSSASMFAQQSNLDKKQV